MTVRSAFAALLSMYMLVGCGPSSDISPNAVKLDLKRIPNLERSSEHRATITSDRVPNFVNYSAKSTRKIDLYITPSCPFCVSLFNGIMSDGVLGSKLMESYAVSVHFVPRRRADFEIISNLTCLPGKKIPVAMSEYYQGIINLNGDPRGIISVSDLAELSKNTARRHGATDASLKGCSDGKEISAAVMNNWEAARALGKGNSWPLVVIDGSVSTAELPIEVIADVRKLEERS